MKSNYISPGRGLKEGQDSVGKVRISLNERGGRSGIDGG